MAAARNIILPLILTFSSIPAMAQLAPDAGHALQDWFQQQFLAVTALKLAEEGKLSLDDKVARLFPQLAQARDIGDASGIQASFTEDRGGMVYSGYHVVAAGRNLKISTYFTKVGLLDQYLVFAR